jgi:hypothetical protein
MFHHASRKSELEPDHSLGLANRSWHGQFGSIRNRRKYARISCSLRCTRWRIRLGRHDTDSLLNPGKIEQSHLGAGPMFVLPTATGKLLGQGKLRAGPSLVAVVQPGSLDFWPARK